MDPAGGVGGGGGREEAERWLSIAEKLVAARDFVSCRHFAERALELYPLLDPGAAAAERILATADVLIAAQATPRPFPYSILQVDPNSALPAITRAFRRLAFLLRPDSKPSASAAAADAYKLVSDAFSLLSDPSKKGLIDAELKNSSNPANPPSSAASSAFWTVCPSCHHIHEYACEFRDRMLRCPRCKKAFKASELPAPPPIVPGTDMYYCSWGFYPIGVPSAADIASGWKPFIPMFPRPQPASATADGNANSQVEMESGKDKKEAEAAVPVGRNKKKMARKRAGVNLKRRVLGGSPAMLRREAWEGTEMKDSRVNINVGKGGVDVHREVVGNVKAGKVGEGGNVGSVHIDLEAEDVDATDDVLGNLQNLPFLRDEEIQTRFP